MMEFGRKVVNALRNAGLEASYCSETAAGFVAGFEVEDGVVVMTLEPARAPSVWDFPLARTAADLPPELEEPPD